jgi:hypothetical protein
MIAFDNGDSVYAIYCHWDGYPQHNGKILLENYDTIEKVEELLDLGNLSALGPEIGQQHPFNSNDNNWCKAYGRDRGEKNQEAGTYATLSEACAAFGDSDYFYLFDGHGWMFRKHRGSWMQLTPEYCA